MLKIIIQIYVVIGTESWLSPVVLTREVFPPKYQVFRKDRKDGYGGVFLALNCCFICSEITMNTSCEVVACKVEVCGTSLIVCAIYRPPNNDDVYLNELCKVLYEIISKNPKLPIWVAGDFNLPNIDWNNLSITSYNYPLQLCDIMLDFVADSGLTQIVHSPTRENNILDIFLTNRPSLISDCHTLSGISNHEIVFINSYISAKIQRPIQRKILLWNKANLENVRLNASNLVLDFMNSYDIDTAVEILWERFKSICNACLDLIPCKLSSTRFNQPWITRNIKSLSRKKQRSYNQARALNTSEAWVKYKELKQFTQQECRKAYNHFIANLTDVNKPGSSKKFWSFIKSKRKDQCEVPPLVCNGATHTDDLTKANVLNNQFTSVFTNERTSYIRT